MDYSTSSSPRYAPETSQSTMYSGYDTPLSSTSYEYTSAYYTSQPPIVSTSSYEYSQPSYSSVEAPSVQATNQMWTPSSSSYLESNYVQSSLSESQSSSYLTAPVAYSTYPYYSQGYYTSSSEYSLAQTPYVPSTTTSDIDVSTMTSEYESSSYRHKSYSPPGSPGLSEKRFRCEYEDCSYTSKRRRDILRHQGSVHLNHRKFVCDGKMSEEEPGLRNCSCGRLFNRKDNLRNHLRIRSHHD